MKMHLGIVGGFIFLCLLFVQFLSPAGSVRESGNPAPVKQAASTTRAPSGALPEKPAASATPDMGWFDSLSTLVGGDGPAPADENRFPLITGMNAPLPPSAGLAVQLEDGKVIKVTDPEQLGALIPVLQRLEPAERMKLQVYYPAFVPPPLDTNMPPSKVRLAPLSALR